MRLVVVGLNHKTAPVAMRERLAFGSDLSDALLSLQTHTDGATIVSTCNRSEIYAYLPNLSDDDLIEAPDEVLSTQDEMDFLLKKSTHAIVEWLAQFKGVDPAIISPYLYIYDGHRALNHWLRVAVGLDSMILGEPQILGQIKQAVASAAQAKALGSTFQWLTQQIFAAAKVVRRDTSLGRQAVSLGFATAKLVTQIFDNPAKTTLLIVAAGEMNRLVAHNVANLGMHNIIICNRSHDRASKLANELQQMAQMAGRQVDIKLAPLDKLPEMLQQSDVVSSCSGSMHTLIDVDMIKTAMKARRQRTMLLVDLAVPRDIMPEVGKLDNVYLYSIDDLQHVIAGNLEERKQAAVEAELLVSQLTAKIEAQLQIANMGQVIHAYQAQAQAKTDVLLSHAKQQLATGKNADEILSQLTHQLQHTLMHPTLKLLRQSAVQFNSDTCHELGEILLNAYR